MESAVIPASAHQQIVLDDDWEPVAGRYADDDWDSGRSWKQALASERARTLRRKLQPVAVAALGLVATAAIGSFLSGNVDPSALRDPVPAAARLQAMLSENSGSNDFALKYLSLANEISGNPTEGSETLLGGAAPFVFSRGAEQRLTAAQCLATAAWYEAGDDPAGQRSVMQVILNRVRHPAFPSSVCGVVFQGSELSTGCQFTFTCDGSLTKRKPPAAQWSRAFALSQRALSGDVDSSVREATHYHADYVQPWWSSQLQQVSKVGPHIFYRWNGRGVKLSTSSRSGEEVLPAALFAGTRASSPEAANSELSSVTSSTTTNAQFAAADAGQPAPASDIPGRQVVQLSPGSASGRWAVDALGRCGGRKSCQVVGYQAGHQVSRNRGKVEVERPEFLFVRDGASGKDLALWDCAKVSRPDASQCLPADQAELRRLLRAGIAK